MKSKFRQWQWVICTHYKSRPRVQITDIIVPLDEGGQIEIWVEEDGKKGLFAWWGPESWFKAVRPVRRPKGPRKPSKHSGFLCEDNIVGCTCNQTASVGR